MAAGFKTATVASGDVPSTQTNFPSYVDLSRLGITTLAEAQSVRVYADSGKTTEWAREIVSATEMHVKVPSLTSTTSIYIDWDGSSADYAVTDTYGRNAVWSDYVAVWHLEDNRNDSTVNAYHLDTDTSGASTFLTGAFGSGKGIDLNSGGHARTASALLSGSTNDIRLSAWVRPQNTTRKDYASLYGYILLKSSRTSGKLETISYYSGGPAIAVNSASYTNNVWYLAVSKTDYSATDVEHFTNGVSTASATTTGTRGTASAFSIGGEWAGAWYNDSGATDVDEVRLREDLLNDNWETTEYNNQSDEAGFWGTWSDVGGVTDTTKFFAMM